MEERIHRVAEVNAKVSIASLEQQIGTYRAYIHAFAYSLFLASIHVTEGFYVMAYFKFRTEIEEYTSLIDPLLPFELYRYAEEEMAQAAVTIVGSRGVAAFVYHFSSTMENAYPILFDEGIVTIYTERTISPAESDIGSPVGILFKIVVCCENIETEFP